MEYKTCKCCGTSWTIPGCPTPEKHNLRERRLKMGLSIREVARRLKLSAAFISDVEHEKRNPNDAIRKFYKLNQER